MVNLEEGTSGASLESSFRSPLIHRVPNSMNEFPKEHPSFAISSLNQRSIRRFVLSSGIAERNSFLALKVQFLLRAALAALLLLFI